MQSEKIENDENDENDEIDISSLLNIIWYRKWLTFLLLGISILTALFLNDIVQKKYISSINVQLNLSSSGAGSLLESLSFGQKSSGNYGQEIELLKSRKLLFNVVDTLSLNNKVLKGESNIVFSNPYFEKMYFTLINIKNKLFPQKSKKTLYSQNEETSEKIASAKTIQEMISINYSESGKYLSISIESYSAELSTKLVNTIAIEYQNYKMKEIENKNETTLSWFTDELKSIQKNIIDAESELKPLSGDEDSPDIQIMIKLKENELRSLSNQKNKLDEKIRIDEIHYNNLNNISDPLLILESPILKPTPTIEKTQNSIFLAETRLLETSLKYGPKHPNYIKENENLINEKSTLNRQVTNLLNTQKSIFEIEKDQLTQLENSISEIKIELKNLADDETTYIKKVKEINSYQDFYKVTLQRFQEAQTLDNFKQAPAIILDYALIEDAKLKNKSGLVSILSVLLGTLIGIFLSLFLEFVSPKLRKGSDLFYLTKLPILTYLPKVSTKKNTRTYKFIHEKAYLESIYRLRTRLRTIDHDKKSISITSPMPKEGKTTTTLHLAKVLSELEKVLVIDIDFRRHSITKSLNISTKKAGLSDIILKKAKFSEAITRNNEEGFDVLGAGTALTSPNVLLSSDMMKKILFHLSKHYDRIIIETPPVQLFSDAEGISKLVDTTILLVKSNYTKKKDFTETLHKMEQMRVNILGIILNQDTSGIKEKHYEKYIRSNL